MFHPKKIVLSVSQKYIFCFEKSKIFSLKIGVNKKFLELNLYWQYIIS